MSPSQVMLTACLQPARFAPGTSQMGFPSYEFPWVLAYLIPGSRKNRLLMPSLFYYQKKFPALLFPLPVSVKRSLAVRSSTVSFIMNLSLFLPAARVLFSGRSPRHSVSQAVQARRPDNGTYPSPLFHSPRSSCTGSRSLCRIPPPG